MLLSNGDYVRDERGGFKNAEGINLAAERIVFKLTARRGAFPLMPQLGSRLYLLAREKPAARVRAAQQYINEALEGETQIALTALDVYERDGQLIIDAKFDGAGESVSLSLNV